jgi:hypothetical protein
MVERGALVHFARLAFAQPAFVRLARVQFWWFSQVSRRRRRLYQGDLVSSAVHAAPVWQAARRPNLRWRGSRFALAPCGGPSSGFGAAKGAGMERRLIRARRQSFLLLFLKKEHLLVLKPVSTSGDSIVRPARASPFWRRCGGWLISRVQLYGCRVSNGAGKVG